MGLVVVNALCLRTVSGHGQLTVPRVRPDIDGNLDSYRQREPVYNLQGPLTHSHTYSSTSMRCHDFVPDGEKTQLQAGMPFDVTWTCQACHPGDCYLYLSYDNDTQAPTNFFKIAEFPGCGATDGVQLPSEVTKSVTLPAVLPSCDHCVLRWEWTAHQQVSNIEFYTQCADVTILSDKPPAVPHPMTAISGIEHLPSDAGAYRDVYNGNELPHEQYLVGPAIATYSACGVGSTGCIGDEAPTPTPTPSPSPASTTTTTTTITTQTSSLASTPPPAGCCSWNNAGCGTSTWCSASQVRCEVQCQGSWISENAPTTTTTTPEPGCCSWNSNACGDSEWCSFARYRCEGTCNGQWIGQRRRLRHVATVV